MSVEQEPNICYQCGARQYNVAPEWQPLNTAPRDGTYVLAIQQGAPTGWAVAVAWRTFHPNAPGAPTWRDITGTKYARLTHWMPLPEAP